MSDIQHPVANVVVERFKSQLDAGLRDQINSAQYTELALMIDEAIGEEIAFAIDRIDEVVRKLKAGSHRAELGL